MQTEWEPSDLKITGIVDSKQGKIKCKESEESK
jgi:hypothetical protein